LIVTAGLPGQWPSGGPVARVINVYRAAAPSIDLFAPDIYVPDFKGTCALYADPEIHCSFPKLGMRWEISSGLSVVTLP
jgi:hypothetical protein